MPKTILEVKHLCTSFLQEGGVELRAVDDLSYTVHERECVAIIGESGSGKSVSALSILRLIPYPPGIIKSGEILFQGRDLLQLSDGEMEEIRGRDISMIFQEPTTSLNPVLTIGDQITENILIHGAVEDQNLTDDERKKYQGMSLKQRAWARAAELLSLVDIPNPDVRLKDYPFQFSGGMQQRAMIAMGMSCNPDILICDEPTTALDVTVQAQVLEQLNQLRERFGTALIIITHNLKDVTKHALRSMRKQMQMITQDPFASLDPRMDIQGAISEGMRIHHMGTAKEREETVVRMMEMVGLNPQFRHRFPHEFSGGQRQRISIARALALQPTFIVCDEVVSALDVSIQAQVITLLMRLQAELGLTYVFIGHDLSVVRHISNQVAVMYLGKIMELTDSDELYARPLHPYTQALISAAPIPNPKVDRARKRILLKGEIPSPIHPPEGCNFCTRCPYADERCRREEPAFRDVGGSHFVACHKVTQA